MFGNFVRDYENNNYDDDSTQNNYDDDEVFEEYQNNFVVDYDDFAKNNSLNTSLLPSLNIKCRRSKCRRIDMIQILVATSLLDRP